MDLSNLPLLSVASLALAAYSALTARFISKGEADQDRRLALIEKQMELWWGVVEKHMTTVLHSPHTPDRDKLLEKIQAGEELTLEELDIMADDLESIINDSREIQGNRAAAVFLLACVERCRKQLVCPPDTPVDKDGPT